MSVGGVAAPAVGALADATALLPLIVLPVLGRLLLVGLREPVPPVGQAPAPRPCSRRASA
nr:hypothetical protein [Streptomyces cylindrosporus]